MNRNSGNHVVIGIIFIIVCVLIGFVISRSTTDNEPADPILEANESVDTVQPEPVTNRSADDEDFGGAVVGMLYPEFRDRLIDGGFSPNVVDRTDLCRDEPENFQCDYRFPETDYCSGTGQGYCTYLWIKGTDNFTVTTREHEAGEVVGMNYVR